MPTELTEPIMLDRTGKKIIDALKGIESAITSRKEICYGFHINGNESDPAHMVTYLEDAVGMQPAFMDYTNDLFNYGNWKNAFFMPRPCILSQAGEVLTYLDPDDYEKDTDGNTVTIDDTLVGANVMIEFPKIWLKVVPDIGDDSSGSVYIANKQLDEGFKDYAYIDSNLKHKEHFYIAAYNSANIDNVLRSVSGAQASNLLNGTTEITRATANGSGWYTETAGDIMLINFLLILMSKTVDLKTAFGQGLHTSGSEAVNNGFRTGVHNAKGLFYGTNNGTATNYTNAVKVFGIENYWGFMWRRYAGDMLINGSRKIKLCYGQEDGSTVDNYNATASGYVDIGATPSGTNGGYIDNMKFTESGMFARTANGSASTYYCCGIWFNNAATIYALRGGRSNAGAAVGAFCVHLAAAVSYAHWGNGAAISYK